MCLLEVHAQCNDRFFEVSPDEVEEAELMVEDLVSQVLLELFDEGIVEEVAMCFSTNRSTGLQQCAIQIRAQCNCQAFTLRPRTRKNIKCAVEKNMHTLLRELFGQVKVESVMRCPSLAGIDG
jgi:hypothetical protein